MAKNKKNKDNNTIPKTGTRKTVTKDDIDTSSLTPEQVSQLHLEEAIKESQNPSVKLRKLKNPLSISGCLYNLFFLVVLTLVGGFMFLWLFSAIDTETFNFSVVFMDVMNDFGITAFFQNIGNWIKGIFK